MEKSRGLFITYFLIDSEKLIPYNRRMKFCRSKTCSQINPQPPENFSKKLRNPDGLQNECKACIRKYRKDYAQSLGETLKARRRKSYHNNKKGGVCHQKLRRDATEQEDRNAGHRFDLEPHQFTFSFEYLSPEHKKFIERYEWLGKIGFAVKWCFTARHEGNLAGVVLMSEPTMHSKHKQYEALIQRGACASWAPKNLNSSLVMFSCKWMVQNTSKRLFVAYSDPKAGEIGTIYQACNFLYLGNKFGRRNSVVLENGKRVSSRYFTITYSMKRWARELGIEYKSEWLKPNGFQDITKYPPEIRKKLTDHAKSKMKGLKIVKEPGKGKYALILGKDKRDARRLKSLVSLKTYPYPKRGANGKPG